MIGRYVDDAALTRPGSGRRAMMAVVFCLLTLAFQATAEGDTAEDLVRMGIELYQNRSYDEALAAYDQALLLYPDDLQAWMGKGQVLSALGDHNRSLLAYQNATRIDPGDLEAWFGVGLNRFLLQDLNESLTALEMALEIDGNYTRAWELKSAVLVQMDKNDEALEASRRARMTTASSDTEMLSHSWVSEFFILRQMGRDDEALAALENATTIDPKNYDAWILLGEALQGRGEYNRSLAAYDSLLSNIAPTSPPFLALVLIDKGSVLVDMGRYEEARDLYQQTIDLNFSEESLDQYYLGRAELGKGVSLLRFGDYEEALGAFNRSIGAEPRLADDAWRGIGDARMGLGSYEEALQAYDTALELYPESVSAERGHAWKGRGDALMALGREEDALLAYENASIAYDLAIERPDQARQSYPLNGEFWQNRGAVLEALGLEGRAEEAYGRARELGYGG
ncbi:MAG TPA: tetratricopeptide repeat protein [Methanothrix sp.]|nr:tetratricopeptide repeat protein [Methanothrix sp.]